MRNPLTYHFYFRRKYRRPFSLEQVNLLLQVGPDFAAQFGGEMLSFAVHDYDHVHLLVNLPATLSPADFMRNWKSATGRLLNFQSAQKGAFWQKRFLVKSVSQRAGNVRNVQKYIERNSND